jgi:probable HAF family extracellular repeat protein
MGTNGSSGRALGVSDDGTIIVGWFSGDSTRAFRWSETTGMVDLGVVPGTQSSGALAISGDGSMIFGSSSLPNSVEPFVWTLESGMRHLVDVLTEEYGVGEAIEGWQLGRIILVSNDGRYIVGEGTAPDNGTGTWLVDLGFAPVPEPAAFGLAASIALILMCWRQRGTAKRTL